MIDSKMLDGQRILVFEPSKDMMSMLAGVLAKAGAVILEAGGKQDAVRIIGSRDPDLICLDLTKHGSDGWGVLQFIRDSQPYMLPKTIALVGDSFDWPQGRLLQDCQIVDILKPLFAVNLLAQACRASRDVCNSLAACPMNASCLGENML